MSTRTRSVLLIEDDRDIRETISEVLEEEGYAVMRAANGVEGLDRLRAASELPALILLDLMMPAMDGWAFRTEQKSVRAWAQIPVVILSADGNVQEKAASIDAVGYIRKPLDIYRLLEIIGRLCR